MSSVRSGRIIQYPAIVVLDTDFSRSECFRMTDIACLAQAILGSGVSNTTLVSGLNCTVTSPASLGVDIAPGTIYSLKNYDDTPYGGLPADTTQQLYKQGINLDKTTKSSLNPPATPGDSIAYLIQAQWATQDTENVTRQYYNPSSPQTPISNTAADVRQDYVSITVKASSPAPSPTTPTPDAGFVGLWVVTVPQGATVVTSGMIVKYASAPFIDETLTQKVSYTSLQKSSPIFGTDTSGSANTITVTTTPAYIQVTNGTHIYVKVSNNNTGPSVINISGLGSQSIVKATDTGRIALESGDLIAGTIYEFLYDGTNFQLMNPSSASTLPSGTILDFAGTSVPSGFLACNTSTPVSRTTYASLFAAIGTTWGPGDGSTTFNLPDFRRRTAVGSGGTGTAVLGNAVGDKGGEESHLQTVDELVAHTHPPQVLGQDFIVNAPGSQIPGGTGASGDTDAATGLNVTAGNPFNVIQPSAVVLKIIKT